MQGSLQQRPEARDPRLGAPAPGPMDAGSIGVGSGDRPHSAAPSGADRNSAFSQAELDGQIAALADMDPAGLRAEWRRLYRADPPKMIKRDLLELGVAFKLQERVLGGLGAATKRRLVELSDLMAAKGNLAETRTTRLKPGAKLMRQWGGITHDVTVLEDGFSWRGEHWRSLSGIAAAITGTHWSGPRFFGLPGRPKPNAATGEESADA